MIRKRRKGCLELNGVESGWNVEAAVNGSDVLKIAAEKLDGLPRRHVRLTR